MSKNNEEIMQDDNDEDKNNNNVNDEQEEEEEDELLEMEPVFLNPDDVVEVEVGEDDDDVPMDDDDDDDDEEEEANTAADAATAIPDASKVQLRSHTGPVYCVSAAILHAADPSMSSDELIVVTGGGDDRAYLHKISSNSSSSMTDGGMTEPNLPLSSSSLLLSHAHTDTVSAVSLNWTATATAATTDTTTATGKAPPAVVPKLIAVGGYDGAILLYDAVSGQCASQLEGPTDVEWLSFHPTGTVLLAGSATDGTVWMYHAILKQCLQVFVGHSATTVTAGGFTPDGKWAVTCSADGSLRVWAPKTGAAKHTFKFNTNNNMTSSAEYNNNNDDEQPPAGLTCLAFGCADSPTTSKLVMVGSEDGQAHVCHTVTGKVVHSLRHYELPLNLHNSSNGDEDDDDDTNLLPMSVEAVGFCPCNPLWCATGGVDGALKIWDLTGGQCRQVCRAYYVSPNKKEEDGSTTTANTTIPVREGITRLAWHSTLPVVFCATATGAVRIWDARNGALLDTLTTGGSNSNTNNNNSTVNDMHVQPLIVAAAAGPADDPSSSSRSIVITASDDHTVRLFDVDVPSLLQRQVQQQQQQA